MSEIKCPCCGSGNTEYWATMSCKDCGCIWHESRRVRPERTGWAVQHIHSGRLIGSDRTTHPIEVWESRSSVPAVVDGERVVPVAVVPLEEETKDGK